MVVGFVSKLLLGNGTLKPKLKEELEQEGLVVLEEGLPGSVRYKNFRAPGRRFNGKVTGERIGLGVSEKRVVAYSRSGRAKLVNTEFSNPRLRFVEISVRDDDQLAFRVDYDRMQEPKVSGEVTILARTPNAPAIADHIQARLPG
jgi:hypothetical protein